MKKTSVIIIGLVFVLSGIVYAQYPAPQKGDRALKPRIADRIAQRLDLTEKQQEQLKELNTNWRKERVEINKKVITARKELRELLKEKSPSETVVNQKLSNINTLNLDLKKAGMKVELEKRKVYTDEQWEKVKKMRRFMAMRNRRAHARHPMMGPSGRPYMNQRYMPNYRQFDRRYDFRRDRMNRGFPGMYNYGFGADLEAELDEFTFPFMSDEDLFVFDYEEDLFYEDDIPFEDFILENE